LDSWAPEKSKNSGSVEDFVAALCGKRIWFGCLSVFFSQLPRRRGGGKEEFLKAAQCDTYLLQMARGFVNKVNQGFVERFPKVSDLEPRSRICIIERRGLDKDTELGLGSGLGLQARLSPAPPVGSLLTKAKFRPGLMGGMKVMNVRLSGVLSQDPCKGSSLRNLYQGSSLRNLYQGSSLRNPYQGSSLRNFYQGSSAIIHARGPHLGISNRGPHLRIFFKGLT
jgi:hypothetical protein